METTGSKYDRIAARKRLRDLITGYLETRTYWGKFLARPAQIKAEAKKMEQANRIPLAVAALLKKVA